MSPNSWKLGGVSMMLKSDRNLELNLKLLTIMIMSGHHWTLTASKTKYNLLLNPNMTIGLLGTWVLTKSTILGLLHSMANTSTKRHKYQLSSSQNRGTPTILEKWTSSTLKTG